MPIKALDHQLFTEKKQVEIQNQFKLDGLMLLNTKSPIEIDSLTFVRREKLKKQRQNQINKVLKWIQRLLEIDLKKKTISSKSLTTIQNKFPKETEQSDLYLGLLELFLIIYKKITGFSYPELSHSVEIKREKPLLRPEVLYLENLSSFLYGIIDNQLDSKLDQEQEFGQLGMFLCLKEGITIQKDIVDLITTQDNLLRFHQQWVYRQGDNNILLSPLAESLIMMYRINWDAKKPKKSLIGCINLYLDKKGTDFPYSICFSHLKSAEKIQTALMGSASRFALNSGLLSTVNLSNNTLFRLIHNKPVENHQSRVIQTTDMLTKRQGSLWKRVCSSLNESDLVAYSLIKEKTVSSQLDQLMKLFSLLKGASNQPLKKTQLQLARNALISKLRDDLSCTRSATELPWLWLVKSWLYKLLKQGGMKKKYLRENTIESYIRYVAEPFLLEFIGCDPSLLSSDEWAEKLNLTAESIGAASKRKYVLYFTEFLINSDVCQGMSLTDLDIAISKQNVDANILSHYEADKVIKLLLDEEHVLTDYALIIFCLGFYCGLRRGEITGLQYQDFVHIGNYAVLSIRANEYRKLKTTSSARNLPIDVLMPEELLRFFSDYVQRHKHRYTQYRSLIFPNKTMINRAFTLLIEVMRVVTGDSSFRFQYLRHSFASWNWFLLNRSEMKIEDTLFNQAFLHKYLSIEYQLKLEKRLGLETATRKKLWALSSLLGHSHVSVTTSNYIHIDDFINFYKYKSDLKPSRKLLTEHWGYKVEQGFSGRPRLSLVQEQKSSIYQPIDVEYPLLHDIVEISGLLPQEKALKAPLTLVQCWQIIRRKFNQQNVYEVANHLGIPVSVVQGVFGIVDKHANELITQNRLLTRQLSLLLKNKRQLKQLTEFIQRYQRFVFNGNGVDTSFYQPLYPLLKNLVRAKSHLLRTSDTKLTIHLLKLMADLELPQDKIELKWYINIDVSVLSREEMRKEGEIYTQYLSWWYQKLNQLNLNDIQFDVYISKDSTGILPYLNNVKRRPIITDEAKYLTNKKSYVSIHYLERLESNMPAIIDVTQSANKKERKKGRALLLFFYGCLASIKK
ncbi:tyrosine-type recombinase/integrase [Vibrio sp. SS-MA-C1-2]|uniref:tyrosine-type recombinase/integrase n=1 Tax=Vibrio sp. SS-MA-C1-2 TaxID=2908646 RepID=UPI001F2F1D27|nr:tyrosine-type recombinase/integrase [Vibrio sp. SS-MA-C1-2]UJF17098.1 tyrosine-type recombinase/integrase [Vibrio sp. SS-MA-C1-2]